MKYDLVVIGGGPAGMMAAGRAGELGFRVLLLEKNTRLGNKLLITGNGRCNISNYLENNNILTSKYGPNGKFLFSAFSSFGPRELVDFFEKRGLKTKTEKDSCIFPVSDRSLDVLDILLKYMHDSGVRVNTNMEVSDFILENNLIKKIILSNGLEIESENYLISTGGKSYPGTGSSGDGYIWARKMGHNIIEPRPAITPIILNDEFIKALEGLSLKDVSIAIFKNNEKIDSRRGDAIFTKNGMSGPIVLEMSKYISCDDTQDFNLVIDFLPDYDLEKLDKSIQDIFQLSSGKFIKNSLDKLFPSKLIKVILNYLEIKQDTKVNEITREERKKIVKNIKNFSLSIKGLVGFSNAVITTGGIDIKEIDPKTMKSKIIDNLFFAGEIIDLDGPSGGFNLQVSWSTGYAVGNNLKITGV